MKTCDHEKTVIHRKAHFGRARAEWVAALMAVAAASVPAPASADATAYPSALSSRIVRFVADPDQTYVLYLRPGMVTDVELPQSDPLVSLVLGDTTRWIVAKADSGTHVLIKPAAPGIETSATLITQSHTYQMMLVSRPEGPWYQQVRFQMDSPIVLTNPAAEMPSPSDTPEQADIIPKTSPSSRSTSADTTSAAPSDRFSSLDLASVRWDWHVIGKAPFAPKRVFSSPDFVWMELPPDAPQPVVFAQQGGQWGIVNYDLRGRWIVVQGAPDALELRANGQAIQVLEGDTKSATSTPSSTNNTLPYLEGR